MTFTGKEDGAVFCCARICHRAGGGGNAPPLPPGMTSVMPGVSVVVRSRLKSTITCGSTEYFVARAPTVSDAFVVTTTPWTGGMTIWSPGATETLGERLVFDQRVSATLPWYFVAIVFWFSPGATMYVKGWWVIGAAVRVRTRLM